MLLLKGEKALLSQVLDPIFSPILCVTKADYGATQGHEYWTAAVRAICRTGVICIHENHRRLLFSLLGNLNTSFYLAAI